MLPFFTASSHNFTALLACWKKWARAHGYRLATFGERDGYPLVFLRPQQAAPEATWWYFSAGIHGDESAGPLGLWHWAESSPAFLTSVPSLIFPCLNPWGLINNSRTDASGIDLNRAYGDPQGPCAAQVELLQGHVFRAACCLHEDYDASGIYLYELRERKAGYGERILQEVETWLPRDARSRIEGRRFARGLLSRAARRDRLPADPEAVFLWMHHTRFSFTFETPSEADLALRVKAQVAFLRAVTNLLGPTSGS